MRDAANQPQPVCQAFSADWAGTQSWTQPWTQGWRLTMDDESLASLVVTGNTGWPIEQMLAGLSGNQRRRAATFQRPERRHEYVTSRWLLSRWPDDQIAGDSPGDHRPGISHCRRFIAVSPSAGGGLGLDVECRVPRHPGQVAAQLAWPAGLVSTRAGMLAAWTAWEAWCKLNRGSVLDRPDPAYARVLATMAEAGVAEDRHWCAVIDGRHWMSVPVDEPATLPPTDDSAVGRGSTPGRATLVIGP